VTNRFDRDTSIALAAPAEAGEPDAKDAVYEGCIDPGWFVHESPNGGYVAALVLRALQAAVDDDERAPRSLTLHYTAPPRQGPMRVETHIERSGRSLTTVTARMVQEGRLLVVATGAFSRPRQGTLERNETRMPRAEDPGRCPALASQIPIHDRYEHRWAIGNAPWGRGRQALCGGWIRLREPRRVDTLLAAAYTDAFPPALFSILAPDTDVGPVPTIDLTIHFREDLPLVEAAEDAYTLAVFRTRLVRDGFLEEDGELWSPDGRLLAQSRQFAIASVAPPGLPPRPGRHKPLESDRLSRNAVVRWLERLRRRD